MTHRIIPRDEWGARYGTGWAARPLPAPDAWLHHSVTHNVPTDAAFDQDATEVRVLDRIGYSRFRGTGGEKAGISYTYVVAPSGRIFAGHDPAREASHTKGHNRTGVGIALIGDYTDRKPTEAQLDAVAWLLNELVCRGELKTARLRGGHRDAPGSTPTACPGDSAHPLIPEINRRAAGTPAPTPPKEAPPMARRRPTAADIRSKQAELSARGFNIYCGPTYIERCIATHGHGKGSRHFARPGHAIDVGFDPSSGAAVSRWEQAHLDALVRELLADPNIDWGIVWNRGPSDHHDHAHLDDVANYSGRYRFTGVTGVTLDPRAFPKLARPSDPSILRLGSRGAAVTAWQSDLRKTGAKITADGVFGPATETATKAFQRGAKIAVDGIVGAASRAAMAKALKPKPAPKPPARPAPKPTPPARPTLRQGSRGAAVKGLQSGLLRSFPAYAGPIKRTGGADGVFGSGTVQVVREFQRRAGLAVDGVVGARTWAALAKYGIRP